MARVVFEWVIVMGIPKSGSWVVRPLSPSVDPGNQNHVLQVNNVRGDLSIGMDAASNFVSSREVAIAPDPVDASNPPRPKFFATIQAANQWLINGGATWAADMDGIFLETVSVGVDIP